MKTGGAFEAALNQSAVRVYDLSCERIHVDATSVSAYATVNEGGLFQFGHSKDQRPDFAASQSDASGS